MVIGQRIRELRNRKGLSQGTSRRRLGLLRCYISRVEDGHTVPSVETLERFSAALDVPLYQLFCNEQDNPRNPSEAASKSLEELAQEGGPSGVEARLLLKLKPLVTKLTDPDRKFLLNCARKLCSPVAREIGGSNG
jgi:transcriptional regulator with XRE-family HTH domain